MVAGAPSAGGGGCAASKALERGPAAEDENVVKKDHSTGKYFTASRVDDYVHLEDQPFGGGDMTIAVYARWDALNELCADVGCALTFTLNALAGRRLGRPGGPVLLRAARLHPLRDRAALLLGDEADVEVVHLRV